MPPKAPSVTAILEQAMVIRDRVKRAVYVRKASAGRPSVLAEVESLLDEQDRSRNVLGVPTTILGGALSHYEILERLGRGGMGEVYKARDTTLGRLVAIKALPKWASGDRVARKRLMDEAKTASSLNHPNIVTIFETLSVKGRDYLVMEYIEGRTLHQLIPASGLTTERALSLGLQFANALSTTHAAGIFHGDLTPSNIMVRPDGHAKLLDFGVSRRAGDTGESEEFRTIPYRAPEQELSARSEVFSFGLIFFEMLCGYRPYAGKAQKRRLAIRPKVPSALAHIIDGCLKRDPADRYASMTEVFEALKAIAEKRHRAYMPTHAQNPPREVSADMRRVRALLPRIGYQSLGDSRRAFDEIVALLKNDPSQNVRDAVSADMRSLILTTPDGFTGISRSARLSRNLAADLIVMATKGQLTRLFAPQDLEGLDLYQMDFSKCDLAGLSFADSFLAETSFEDSRLAGAKFGGAYIRNVNFKGADLTGCDFTAADWFNALGLKSKQLACVKTSTLMECPNSSEGLYNFIDGHYGIPFRSWADRVQKDLFMAWKLCLEPGGLRDYVSRLRRKSR